jgi:hypothetical protein
MVGAEAHLIVLCIWPDSIEVFNWCLGVCMCVCVDKIVGDGLLELYVFYSMTDITIRCVNGATHQ